MDRRQLLFGMTALAVGSPSLNDFLTAQSIETANQSSGTNQTRRSDREKAGLRGLVKTCVEGQIKTEYDPAGRMISSRWSANVDGSESIEMWTYDGSGRLLRTTSRNRDGSPAEQVYFYDEKGRLLSIIEGGGDRTSFQYDEQGLKTEIRSLTQKPDKPREAVAVGLGAVFADVEGFGSDSPGNASSIKTTYNDHDQPRETQAYDADGHLLSRLVRTYDEEERISDLKAILADPTSLFPAKEQAQMIAQSGLPRMK